MKKTITVEQLLDIVNTKNLVPIQFNQTYIKRINYFYDYLQQIRESDEIKILFNGYEFGNQIEKVLIQFQNNEFERSYYFEALGLRRQEKAH